MNLRNKVSAERRWLLFGWGCIAVTLRGATMYYGNVYYGPDRSST